MSKTNRTSAEPGITTRHARSCRHRETRCTCDPSYRAEAFDAATGKRIYKTFPTITAARRWRQDAYAALRAGTLSADRGPTLREAADDWMTAARAGIVRTRSGEV
jgi:hypothetical protein